MKTIKRKLSLKAVIAILVCSMCQQAGRAQINADFSYSNGPNGTVNFVSTSTGTTGSTTYAWSFGDGTYETGIAPSHTYGVNGTYYPLLSVCDTAGSNMDTNYVSHCDTVRLPVVISNTSCAGYAWFHLSKDSNVTNSWNAEPHYPGSILSAVWSWGDGTSSTGLYPSHTYSAVGLYHVCLTATFKCDSATSSYTYCDSSYLYKPAAGEVNGMISVRVMQPSVATGIASQTQVLDHVGLYPNPAGASAGITMNSAVSSAIRIKVINALGQEVIVKDEKAEPGANTFALDLKDLQQGLYYVSVKAAEGRGKTIKLIKE